MIDIQNIKITDAKKLKNLIARKLQSASICDWLTDIWNLCFLTYFWRTKKNENIPNEALTILSIF